MVISLTLPTDRRSGDRGHTSDRVQPMTRTHERCQPNRSRISRTQAFTGHNLPPAGPGCRAKGAPDQELESHARSAAAPDCLIV
jgi:hypothetical protein